MPKTRTTYRPIPFNAADDRLSRCASALLEEVGSVDAAIADVHLFGGGGDCVALVAKGAAKRAKAIVSRFGFASVEDVVNAIEARTTYKFVYEMGFGSIAAEAQ